MFPESLAALPESAQRVARLLLELGHDKPVVVLPQTGKTSAEAAAGLGCEVAQIAKSIIFRRAADNAPVLVIASAHQPGGRGQGVPRRWARWPRPTPSSCAT